MLNGLIENMNEIIWQFCFCLKSIILIPVVCLVPTQFHHTRPAREICQLLDRKTGDLQNTEKLRQWQSLYIVCILVSIWEWTRICITIQAVFKVLKVFYPDMKKHNCEACAQFNSLFKKYPKKKKSKLAY